jgi:hypothetical protein
MKKVFKTIIFPLFFLCFMAIAQSGLTQAPPPPPTSGSKGDATNKGPGGGGAPISGGVIVCLAMVAGFGTWKLYKAIQGKRNPIEP